MTADLVGGNGTEQEREMAKVLEFDDPGAGNDHPVKGITMGDIRAWHYAFRFIANITEEELLYAEVGTGAEVALRHAHRKAKEAL